MSDAYWLRLSPRDPATGAVAKVLLAGGGANLPYRHPVDGRQYRTGIVSRPLFSARLGYERQGWTGRTTPQTTTIAFSTADRVFRGQLDRFLWEGADAVLEIGPEGFAPSRKLVGRVKDAVLTRPIIEFTILDLVDGLEKPVASATYSGDGGIEGPAEAKGRLKRRSWGYVFNVEGRLEDVANSVYEFGDPAFGFSAWAAIRDKGREGPFTILPWQGSIEATRAALAGSSPARGGGVVAPSIARAKWWTQPSGPLTADIIGTSGTGGSMQAPAIVDALLAKAGLVVSDLAGANALRPAITGLHIDSLSETYAQAIDRLLLGLSLNWTPTPDGQVAIREWAFDEDAPVLKAEFQGRARAFAPHGKRQVSFQRNERPHSDGEIAGVLLEELTDGGAELAREDLLNQHQEWGDVQDGSGTKPADNATVGAPSGTPVGDRDADTLTGEVDQAKADISAHDQLLLDQGDDLTVLRGDVDLADTRITDARAIADGAALEADRAHTRIDSINAAGNGDFSAIEARVSAVESVNVDQDQAVAALQTIVQTGDNSNASLRADVTAQSTAITDLDQAIADDLTALRAGYGGNLAQFDQRITGVSDASAALADRTEVLEAVSATSINPNPQFADWTDGATLPRYWTIWEGLPARFARLTVSESLTPVLDVTNTNTAENVGIKIDRTVAGLQSLAPGDYVLELDAQPTYGGSWTGTAFGLWFYDEAGQTLGYAAIDCKSDPLANGALAPWDHRSISRWRKLVKAPAGTRSAILYLLHNYPAAFGTDSAAKRIRYYRAAARAATSEESRSNSAIPALQASVTEQASAIAEVSGRTLAFWQLTANAGTGAEAFIAARAEKADGSVTSSIAFGAREVHVFNDVKGEWRKTLSILNGNVLVQGNLTSTAGIYLGSGNLWQVALASRRFLASDGDTISFGLDLGNIPEFSYERNNLAPLAAGEAYKFFADDASPTGFVARLRIVTPGGTTSYAKTNDTAPGTGPTRQIDKGGDPDAANNTYRLRVQGTWTGQGYYFDSGDPFSPGIPP